MKENKWKKITKTINFIEDCKIGGFAGFQTGNGSDLEVLSESL